MQLNAFHFSVHTSRIVRHCSWSQFQFARNFCTKVTALLNDDAFYQIPLYSICSMVKVKMSSSRYLRVTASHDLDLPHTGRSTVAHIGNPWLLPLEIRSLELHFCGYITCEFVLLLLCIHVSGTHLPFLLHEPSVFIGYRSMAHLCITYRNNYSLF